jgi:hypothetical protein
MPGKTSNKPAKAAKKTAAKRVAAKPKLLSGGNPQIAKGEIQIYGLTAVFRL